MFRRMRRQGLEFDAAGLLPRAKAERCEASWAGPFRRKALPILTGIEEDFAGLFDPEMGRPNRPIPLVLGTLILKEMFDLTDQEALDALEFDSRWWWAFQLDPRESRLSQKTLHNYRVELIKQGKSKLAFRKVTDELIRILGVNVARQRLDSTHILSNFALLTRLGLFCETIRVFLGEVKKLDAKLYEELSQGLRRRHGEEASYQDARREKRPRRLRVAARDVWRLIEQFKGNDAVTKLEGWKLLSRLFDDQCEVLPEPKKPESGDDDEGDREAPVELKVAKEIGGDSLQTPHDPDVTYSGHKGKGQAAQIAETCTEGNPVQLISDVEVTRACDSDAKATVPMVQSLKEAGQKPTELVADTGFSSAQNAADLAKSDVNLLAPVPAPAKPDPEKEYPPPSEKCPKDRKGAAKWQQNQEAHTSFNQRYSIRAGIEGTNSEMKRAHGLRKLRVRGEDRVKLAVYFKALACNLKRALRWWLQCMQSAEGAAALG